MAYMLNLDMVGRVQNETLYVGGHGTAPSFDEFLNEPTKPRRCRSRASAAAGSGPSDHMSFAAKKIPVLFFFSGHARRLPPPHRRRGQGQLRGHREVVDLAGDVIAKLLAHAAASTYVESADAAQRDRRHARHAAAAGSRRRSASSRTTRHDDVKGVRITGTSPGSPAAEAGLKEGDVIVQWNDGQDRQPVRPDRRSSAKAKPGDKVKLEADARRASRRAWKRRWRSRSGSLSLFPLPPGEG